MSYYTSKREEIAARSLIYRSDFGNFTLTDDRKTGEEEEKEEKTTFFFSLRARSLAQLSICGSYVDNYRKTRGLKPLAFLFSLFSVYIVSRRVESNIRVIINFLLFGTFGCTFRNIGVRVSGNIVRLLVVLMKNVNPHQRIEMLDYSFNARFVLGFFKNSYLKLINKYVSFFFFFFTSIFYLYLKWWESDKKKIKFAHLCEEK